MTLIDYDVAIVGASIAGTTCAKLMARQGLKVLMIDRKRSLSDFKMVCTTFIQRSALPVIHKLGLKERLEAEGAIRNNAEFWTEYGWIRDSGPRESGMEHGYSIRREILDPMLMSMVAEEPNVTTVLGSTLSGLNRDSEDLIRGIEWQDRAGQTHSASASLVVLADGRNSAGAKMAEVPTRYRNNNRFVYFCYYKDMPLKTGEVAQFWQVGKDMRFAYPFDEGLTMLCSFVTQDKYAEWAKDKRGRLEDSFRALPNSPDQSRAQPVSKVRGMRKMNDYRRPAAFRGLALVGDACMSCDPMSGVGCGFAFQSADWLASEVTSFVGKPGQAAALEKYRHKHRQMLAGHEYFIQDASTDRLPNLLEKAVSRAAVQDPEVARRLHRFVARVTRWTEFLTPETVGRIILANIAYGRASKRKHVDAHG